MTDTERQLIHRAFHPAGAVPTGDVAAQDTLSDLLSLEHVAVLSRNRRHAEALLAFNGGHAG